MLAGAASTSGEDLVADSNRFVVIARDGLRLRSGPSLDANVIQTLPVDTQVIVLSRDGDNGVWAMVDLEGDGRADGFVSFPFLRSVDAGPVAGVLGDITEIVTPEMVKQTFPDTPVAKIRANLPSVFAGLRARALGDRAMVLMSIATIRAETEGFVPIDEGKSQFNTRPFPGGPAFNLYDAGTEKGAELGNTVPGDGPKFKGRGFVQLTGRDNYTRIGPQVGATLVNNPALANDPALAGLILAQFLKNKESAIRTALAQDNLRKARRLVNGGSHGFDRFEDTYNKGLNILPH
jgi:hypothetical protein